MPAEKENQPTETDTRPATASPRKLRLKSHRKAVIGILIIVLVLILGWLAYEGVHHHNQERRKSSNAAVDKKLLANLSPSQKAEYLASQGDYAGAEQAWQDQLAKAKTTQDKLGIYYQQSALAVSFKHYDDAKKYAKEAKKLSPDSPTPYVALAQIAQAQGDKVSAQKYWQEAIDHLDHNDPAYNLKKHDYQSSLDSLK